MKKIMIILPMLVFLGGCDLFVDPEIKREFEAHKKAVKPINCMPGFGEEGKKRAELCEYAHEKGYGDYVW